MSPERALEVQDLLLSTAAAGNPATANQALSLSVGGGESITLLGLRDGGAPDLLDTIAGHLPAAAGRIRVDGRDVAALPPGDRRIGLISARDPLFRHLTVRRNIGFPLRARRVPEPERTHRVDQLLALLGLEADADRRPRDLSPARTVRAALARALAADPAFILLDDPFAALDPVSRRELHQVLRQLVSARGLGLLLATSDREDALSLGGRIGILDRGRLRQLATAPELLDRPADETVATVFGGANSLTGQVQDIEDDVALVRLSAGPTVEAMAAEGLQAGMLCIVCIRPERVAVAFLSGAPSASGDGQLGSDVLPATLSETVHLGDHLRLRFRLAGGGEMVVHRPASQPTSQLKRDRPAELAWQPSHAIAFPAPDM
ncbi:ABC transporter ATP-binding protein [Lichenicoccus roseus]|uniref:ABC transporter ATP-binding protein n=1 Tax=Lichenicoccus roseus TaxID=2683649 RepID=A0A5R9J238_9PROT|nr:ABC transporter ATP-binding protein [Lichenicoccus roseus]TLU71622.1 ABC transporter ATP-binding protein [Lichenicoccus roseus]